MHSFVTTMTVAQLQEATKRGNLVIDSDLNRGSNGETVWSEARKTSFVTSKLLSMPSQNLTLVQIAKSYTSPASLTDGVWKVLDGRNRLCALLEVADKSVSSVDGTTNTDLWKHVQNITLIIELIRVSPDERDQIPAMFTALNNGGIPLTPGEALLVAAAPELTDEPSTMMQLAYKIRALSKAGRKSPDEPDPHVPESIIVHSLWKIRDAIHGPGCDQGKPTLASEHSELFGPGGRRDREQGFASIISLLEFVATCLNTPDWNAIASVFGAAAYHVVALGDRAQVLAYGSVCTNVHDKAWLPCNAVIELLLSQSLYADNPLEHVWWKYFAAFLDRCLATPMNELWIQGLVNYEMQRRGSDVQARRRAAGEFASFARQNCVASTSHTRKARTPTIHRGANIASHTHYRLFQGRRIPANPSHPAALATNEHRLFHGHRLAAEKHCPPQKKLRRANADHVPSQLPSYSTPTRPGWHVQPPSGEASGNAC